MVDYRLNETGENNCEVEWIGKKLKLNLVNLRKMYGDMEFVSSSITTQQCKQFFTYFKKSLKNDNTENQGIQRFQKSCFFFPKLIQNFVN